MKYELSAREAEVMGLIARHGLTNGQIAERLHIQKSTAAKHVMNAKRKTETQNRIQASLAAAELSKGLDMITGTAQGTVRLRTGPGTSYAEHGYLQKGDVIEASENKAQWLHITKINGIELFIELWASAGTEKQYIEWSVVEQPGPEPEPIPDPTIPAVDVAVNVAGAEIGKVRVNGAEYKPS